MRILLTLLLGISPLIAFGRLGETEAQLQQRFGSPTSRSMDKVIAQGRFIDLCPILTFKQDDWYIRCHIVERRSSLEHYSKPGEWTEAQIALVLSSNAQGANWQEASTPSIRTLRREWRREDGATAFWQMGAGFTVTHPAYPRAKQRAEAQAKSDASRLPKL